MEALRNIVEPKRLLLTWQPMDENAKGASRMRRTVAFIEPSSSSQATFRYAFDTDDFRAATALGFLGFPAFAVEETVARGPGVLDSLLKRLPPRKREDFAGFLAQHRLPAPFPASDFALLGYTGARLPSDGFALVPEFAEEAVPCDYITEIAGLRHVFRGRVSDIQPSDSVSFQVDRSNVFDVNAVKVLWRDQEVGFVNRAFKSNLLMWLRDRLVHASVDRLNGRTDRPLLYVRLEVR